MFRDYPAKINALLQLNLQEITEKKLRSSNYINMASKPEKPTEMHWDYT